MWRIANVCVMGIWVLSFLVLFSLISQNLKNNLKTQKYDHALHLVKSHAIISIT